MVVDPNMSIPNVRSLYDLEDEKDDDEEAQEVNINAATQIRGNGNIISIAQYDSMRLANMIAFIVNAARTPEPASPSPTQTQQSGQTLPSVAALSEGERRKAFPKINITVNCGATVIGDRNIVGPGLGDIARQMQLAQRNQAMHTQQQQPQQQQAQCQGQTQRVPSVASQRESLYQAQQTIAQNHSVLFGGNPTPPMSRSPSLQSEEERRRKREADDGGREDFGKRRR